MNTSLTIKGTGTPKHKDAMIILSLMISYGVSFDEAMSIVYRLMSNTTNMEWVLLIDKYDFPDLTVRPPISVGG